MDANVRNLLAQLRQNPLNFSVLDALRQACEATQSFAAWADGLEQHTRASSDADGDPVELGRLHFELGNLYVNQLRDVEQGLSHYRLAIDFDAAHRPALAAARAILSERGDWGEAAELLSREADSLPVGRKRAAAYAELGRLYRTQLHDRDAAAIALREATTAAPGDLQVQHELATLLLEDADASPDPTTAADKRRESADVLASMAGAVSDDYALAYIEAALNAVPDHAASLALLELVAPRMGRADALAPRWLAAIASTKDRTISRPLRLKMANAYLSVGQIPDARICLEPLIAEADPEALELARLVREADPQSEPATLERASSQRPAQGDEQQQRDLAEDAADAEARYGRADEADEADDADELLSAEMMLDAESAETQLEHAPRDELSVSRFARELSELGTDTADDQAGDPLADLAMLDRRESPSALGTHAEVDELSTTPTGSGELDFESSELPLEPSSPHVAPPDPQESAPEPARDVQATGPAKPAFPDASASFASDDDDDAQIARALAPLSDSDHQSSDEVPGPSEQVSAGEAPAPAALPVVPGPEPVSATSEAKPSGQTHIELLQFHAPDDEDEPDPFAEETQPRATPLTLAELTALTGHEDASVGYTPASDSVQREVEEVTQVSPNEDPRLAELRSLRSELAKRLRFRDRRGAAEIAEILVDRGVFDPEAIEALEEHYRLTRDFARLRDLSMRIAREPSFSEEVRSIRLRESIMLSESKLGDPEGAAAALRELRALDPSDAEAYEKLKRLLRRAQHWDELATLLGQRVEELSDARTQAELLRELGAIEREKRNQPAPAIAAYARAHELAPEDASAVALCELYVANGQHEEAARMYEARLTNAPSGERAALLAVLAGLYERELRDDERAQQTIERWRALEPKSTDALNAKLRVVERRGDHRALLDALVDQLELVTPGERGEVHERIAQVALTHLGDPARAADSFAEAIALAPSKRALWQAAAPAFAQAERSSELDELLWGLAQSTRDRTLQAGLLAHLAETRLARGDLQGAILAREAEYTSTQDTTVLATLVALLRTTDRAPELARRLDELARKSDPERARTHRLERAHVLVDKMRDPEAAKAELERLLSELGADDASALNMLVELCIATGDTARRASAQERLIKLAPSLAARVELATALVDVYERELDDVAGATRVLTTWTALEPENPQPYLRLLPLLAQAGKKRELIDALDRLTTLAITDEEAGEFRLRAARVAMEIPDYDGAWNRLVPRVVDADDAAAEHLLRELAAAAGRGEQLAALYVGLAQRTDDRGREKQRWADAARAYEQHVGAHDRALEAMLRALAKQLDSEELLGEVERLAERAGAWPRLAQVYDTIIRKAESTGARIRLLMRHARVLEARADDASAAFERVWLAFQLDPTNDQTYAESIRLSTSVGRRDELLGTYERRAQSSASDESRVEALLAACALAAHRLEDTARATGYLSRAVALAGDRVALLDAIEARAGELDEQHPAINGRGLLAELASVYVTLAGEAPKTPALASSWLARAARLQEVRLDDPDAAFRTLERASLLALSDVKLLDELHRVAALGGNWEGLARHLQHASEVAIDSASSSAALSRLGALCERELASPSRAADAYEQLVRLRPQDPDASRRLRDCLRAAERFDELLIAIDRELFMLKPDEGKRELLKQAAETWEYGLKNRYEAMDAWKKVAAIAPADPDAVAALQRLRSRPRADDSLLTEQIVVLPEDLRPSLQAEPVNASLFSSYVDSSTEESSSFLAPRGPSGDDASIEPEHVTNEDLSLLSGEFSAVDEEPAEPARYAAVGDFDADMTIPLDRDKAERGAVVTPVVTLDGLSSLVSREAAEQPSSGRPNAATPPPPPGPPAPPKAAGDSEDGD
jgi:hypothetical protein